MEKMKFKTIKGFENYEITKNGIIRSKKSGRILKQCINSHGYYKVDLQRFKKRYTIYVHVLVFYTYNDDYDRKKNKKDGLVIDHINNNKEDNRIENLQLISHRENIIKGYLNKKTSSEYTGVSWNKASGKWQVNIGYLNKKYYLGSFDSELWAAYVYGVALSEIQNLKNK